MRELYWPNAHPETNPAAYVLPCAQQHNDSDCGVYAAAFAVELLAWTRTDKSKPPCLNLEFAVQEMRQHLTVMLERQTVVDFPRSKKIGRGRKPQPKRCFL